LAVCALIFGSTWSGWRDVVDTRHQLVFAGPGKPRNRLRGRCFRGAGGPEEVGGFWERREALKRCLAREYRSFFRPFEADFYSDGVTFKDPLNELAGKARYRDNVEMLSGSNPVGNLLFSDGYIDLHSVEEVPGDERRLRTRWTLGFTFALLPWRPQALFTGVSEYVIDARAQVLGQRDYWDTLSLGSGGAYVPEDGLSGVVDLGAQLLPAFLRPFEEPAAAAGGDWALLRRADMYRVYRSKRDSERVFAIGAPGRSVGREELAQTLVDHGLTPGAALRVCTSGRGAVGPDSAAAAPSPEFRGGDFVLGLELLPPHPWQGPPPPG